MGLYSREPIRVGFWRGLEPGDQAHLPDVRQFVDPLWDRAERDMVIRYISDPRFRGPAYRGWSDCRFCRKTNGTADFTDGVYVWPEGLAHYLRDHRVRLPAEFVAHVRSRS